MSQTKAELLNGLSVNTALDDAITVDSSGKVGIGMTPSSGTGYILQLESGQAQTFMSFGNTGSGNGALNGLVVGNDTSRAYFTQRENQPIHIATNNVDQVAIDASGKVGIGTTSPSQQLTLVSSGDSKINIRGHGSSTGYFLGMPDATNAQVWNAENGHIQIATNDSERMRVNSTGSILFHQTTSEVPGLANTVVGACFEKVGTNGSALFISRGDSISLFLNRNNTGEIVTFRQSGTQVGSISTNGSSLPSDRNFKKNITDLTLGLDFVNTLKPSKYNLKLEEDTAPLLFGLIAQDVEESLTAAGVTKNSTVLCQHKPTESEAESDYSLDYGKLIPILINSIKELSTKVAALEAA